MSNLFKRVKSAQEIHEEKVRAYWALFLLMNANPRPEPDGSFYLGELGQTKSDRGVDRPTPYSLGRVR